MLAHDPIQKGITMQHVSILALIALALTTPAMADNIKVDAPWVRATAPGQKVAGGFMTLTADADMVLVGGSSPVSKHIELHYMKMEDGVMEMREMKQIRLPRGKAVALEPGGLHVMFIDLKKPITEGQKVPLSLFVESANGKRKTITLEAEARRTSGH
jgi:copper(I)-binding protein